MVRSLKTGLVKTGSSVVAICGVIVLAVAMLAAVVYRWAMKPTHEISDTELTSESARSEL